MSNPLRLSLIVLLLRNPNVIVEISSMSLSVFLSTLLLAICSSYHVFIDCCYILRGKGEAYCTCSFQRKEKNFLFQWNSEYYKSACSVKSPNACFTVMLD